MTYLAIKDRLRKEWREWQEDERDYLYQGTSSLGGFRIFWKDDDVKIYEINGVVDEFRQYVDNHLTERVSFVEWLKQYQWNGVNWLKK